MQGYRRDGDDLRLHPGPVAIAKAEHVVGEVVAEAESRRVDLGKAACRGSLDPKLVEHEGHLRLRGMGGARLYTMPP